MHRWRKYWDNVDGLHQESEKNSGGGSNTVNPISLPTVLPMLGMLGGGMVVSLIILVIEIIIKKLELNHEKRIKDRQFKMFHNLPFADKT